MTNGRILACVLLLGVVLETPAATAVRESIRISPSAVPTLATNRLRPRITAAVRNQTLEVTIPTNTALFVRKGDTFVSAEAARLEGSNKVYELKPTDIYVARGALLPPVSLSTNAVRMPDTVRGVVGGRDIEGHVDVALQSELMTYNPTTRTYEGRLEVCFRSSAAPTLAERLLPLHLRLHTTPGLQLATNALTLTSVGKAGCRDVAIQCASVRSGAKVIVRSDAVGDQEFMVNFERAPFSERYKSALIILGGIFLGALGGLVRTWHPPRVKQPWKRIAEGGFCGLVLVLLGQLGVKSLFQIEGPVTNRVLLGLCAVFGYIGVRLLERIAPKETGDDAKRDG